MTSKLLAIAFVILGWLLVVGTVLASGLAHQPAFREDAQAQSPLPLPEAGSLVVASVLILGLPGLALCCTALVVWILAERRESRENERKEVLASWSAETLGKHFDQLVTEVVDDRRISLDLEAARDLARDLPPLETHRLKRFLFGSDLGEIPAPPEPTVSAVRQRFPWLRMIALASLGLAGMLGIVAGLATWALSKMDMTPYFGRPFEGAEVILAGFLCFSMAAVPVWVAVGLCRIDYTERRRAARERDRMTRRNGEILEQTTGWLETLASNQGLGPQEGLRHRVAYGLVASVLDELKPPERRVMVEAAREIGLALFH